MREWKRTMYGKPTTIRVAVYDLEDEEDYIVSFSVDHTKGGGEREFNVVIAKSSEIDKRSKEADERCKRRKKK